MTLSDRVHIARRFQRAVRIDTDAGDREALEGFVCPQSSAEVLASMARHVEESGHGAFTWTGPYGSGKSSLIVALNALLCQDTASREIAERAIGAETTKLVRRGLPLKKKGWRSLLVVGRRESPTKILGDAIARAGLADAPPNSGWTEDEIVQVLTSAAAARPRTYGGLIVFVDEMGKFLEAATNDGSDIYLFQQLAEAASRSGGRLVVVGVLHQAFEEYASKLSRQMRDEWSKIQGRFVDLAVNAAGEEQVELIGRAIQSDRSTTLPSPISTEVAELIRTQKKGLSNSFAQTLEECWPLHPVVACLLGPISRRRFGQNQRSIFGFLNSAEPGGFNDFLRNTGDDDLYTPERLWDYLRLNLEPSILASPDSHRWALAAEAIERCEGMGSEPLYVQVLKTIAIIDLFKERSGLTPGLRLVQNCFPNEKPEVIEEAVRWLQRSSFIIYKKFLDAYAIYAGSDFDIDAAVVTARQDLQALDFDALRSLANLQPILAKRHYHKTGAFRWFDVDIAPCDGVAKRIEAYQPARGTIGEFVLVIPTAGETEEQVRDVCQKAAGLSDHWDVVVGFSERSWRIPDLGFELLALEKVRAERSELAGDAVARREVRARLVSVQSELEAELYQAFNTAKWYVGRCRSPRRFSQVELNTLASELADLRFPKAPILHNELLNRVKPSPNAVAAQNALLRRMVLNADEPRLGIKGFPAEAGMYVSLLAHTGLHISTESGARFTSPQQSTRDPFQLAPVWQRAAEYLEEHSNRTVALGEIYDEWRKPPYGVKDGLMPVLAVAFVMSMKNRLAVYREGIFQARVTDVDVDYLAKDPWAMQLRWMDLTDATRHLLSGMADVVRELDHQADLEHIEPIDVARALVAIYDHLPAWTKRTSRLSTQAKQIRDLFKRANDPNKFLFDDIPVSLGLASHNGGEDDLAGLITNVREGLRELVDAYPTMLHRLRETMLGELRVPNDSPQAIAELRERAHNIRQLAGDFRLDAFVSRLVQFEGTRADVEGIAGLAANKPPNDWVDPDVDRATVELADLAHRFVRVEAFAHVKGRADKRHAMAVILGQDGRSTPVISEFDVTDHEQQNVKQLVEELEAILERGDNRQRNVVLAALAELSSRYMGDEPPAHMLRKDSKRAMSQ